MEQYIAGYRVLRRLGSGGTGEVYLVQHPRLPRRDALKLLAAGAYSSTSFILRFQREADLLATLDHPNLVALYDRGQLDGRVWLTMEYVEGTDAAALVRGRGPLPLHVAAQIIDGAGAALDFAYARRRITHRDVKPANILIAVDGDRIRTVKLADFGIARAASESTSLTSAGATVGTPANPSPEAINGQHVDNRSDLYALGCTAFHLLTGGPPFPADSVTALLADHLSAPVPPISRRAPGLPPYLDDVFRRALAKRPEDRYRTAAEFVAALRGAVPEAAGAEPDAPGARAASRRRRSR